MDDCKHTVGLCSPEDAECPECGADAFKVVCDYGDTIDDLQAKLRAAEEERDSRFDKQMLHQMFIRDNGHEDAYVEYVKQMAHGKQTERGEGE